MGRWYIADVGGTFNDLSDLGFKVRKAIGVGTPRHRNINQSFGYEDGGYHQRTAKDERIFVLQCLTLSKTEPTYHQNRQSVEDLIDRDRFPTEQAGTVRYIGDAGTVQIECYFEEGMEMDEPIGFKEEIGLRFSAPQPAWKDTSETQETVFDSSPDSTINYTGTYPAPVKIQILGPETVYSIGNSFTGKTLDFGTAGIVIAGGSTLTIDTTPGQKEITNGTVSAEGSLDDSSGMAAFVLKKGANIITVSSDTGDTAAQDGTLTYTRRHNSINVVF